MVGSAIALAGKGISKAAEKVSKKLSPKTTALLAKFAKPIKNMSNAIGEGLVKLKQKADNLSAFFII